MARRADDETAQSSAELRLAGEDFFFDERNFLSAYPLIQRPSFQSKIYVPLIREPPSLSGYQLSVQPTSCYSAYFEKLTHYIEI